MTRWVCGWVAPDAACPAYSACYRCTSTSKLADMLSGLPKPMIRQLPGRKPHNVQISRTAQGRNNQVTVQNPHAAQRRNTQPCIPRIAAVDLPSSPPLQSAPSHKPSSMRRQAAGSGGAAHHPTPPLHAWGGKRVVVHVCVGKGQGEAEKGA